MQKIEGIYKYTKQCNVWEFRCNKEMFEQNDLKSFLDRIAKKWVFQLEKGNENDYEHYQGRLSLWKIKRGPELAKLILGMDMPLFNYIAPTVTEEHKKEAFYCMKEDTRIEGPWKNGEEVTYIPKQYRNIEMYPWQKQMSTFTFDKDHIDVLVDSKGWSGKSTVCRLNMLKGKSIKLPTHNDGIKLIQSCCDLLIAKQLRDPEFIFIDLPRAFDNDKMAGLMCAIEEIKSGYVYDERNSYKEWWFDSPNIWIFTNNEINPYYLTKERWRFWKINPESQNLERLSCTASQCELPIT